MDADNQFVISPPLVVSRGGREFVRDLAGVWVEVNEVIPAVYFSAAVFDTPGKVADKLRRLFPQERSESDAALWVKYPAAFGVA